MLKVFEKIINSKYYDYFLLLLVIVNIYLAMLNIWKNCNNYSTSTTSLIIFNYFAAFVCILCHAYKRYWKDFMKELKELNSNRQSEVNTNPHPIIHQLDDNLRKQLLEETKTRENLEKQLELKDKEIKELKELITSNTKKIDSPLERLEV